MISKKDALTLGVLAIGGIGVASMVSDSGSGGAGSVVPRAGRILGSQQEYGAGPTIYNLPAQPAVTFPKAPTFDISKFLSPPVEPVVSRGAAGVSAAPKKERVVPYIYRGGEVKAGAVSVAPWAMGTTTPAEMGVTTALGITKKGGFRGTGMTQDAYKSQFAERTYSTGAPTSKKTSSGASKAITHAKRLRAGRGD